MLKEYHDLLQQALVAGCSGQFSDRVLDVSQFASRFPFRGPLASSNCAWPTTIRHLLHGQRVKEELRRLLRSISLQLLEVPVGLVLWQRGFIIRAS
jgi:hypothetical protein